MSSLNKIPEKTLPFYASSHYAWRTTITTELSFMREKTLKYKKLPSALLPYAPVNTFGMKKMASTIRKAFL